MATASLTVDSAAFFDDLHGAPERALLLDYDGTVAPFSTDRRRALPYPTIPEFLDCLISTCRTRVVLISGRAAHDIPSLLGLNPRPEIWGTHGLERLLPDGAYHLEGIGAAALQALARARTGIEQDGLEGLVENKPGAIAVHWRGLRQVEVERIRSKAYARLAPLVADNGLLLAEFDGGLELRVRARNKGDVVRAIISALDKHVPVAYLGDDASDEDAFRALAGRGLSVLVHPTYRHTAARVWLRPPTELVQFLVDWVRACGGDM